MDIGPIEKRDPHELLELLQKLLGDTVVTFSVSGHDVVALPASLFESTRPVTIEFGHRQLVAMPREIYESMLETFEIMNDAEIMGALGEVRAETGDDISLDEASRIVARRDA